MNKQKLQQKERQKKEQARKEYQKKLKPLLYAFVTWFALLAILHIPFIKDHLRQIMVDFTHSAAIFTGKLLFLPISGKGSPVLDYDGFGMRVILECTAYNFYLFVIMITIFSRWSLKDKFINLGIFLGVIFILNNMRFILMGIIGKTHPHLFETIHDYFWNILFGIMIFLVYVWADGRAGGVFARSPGSSGSPYN